MGVWRERYLFIVVLLIAISVSCFGEIIECDTPKNVPGTCVPISRCPGLLSVLKTKNRQPEQTKLLRDSQCGEVEVNKKKQPKVCCPEECGVEALADRIFGGEIASIDQYPWMVLVEYKTKKNTKQLSCGGTLVNERYVITAAHCVFPEYTSQIGTPESIRLGEFNKTSGIDCVPTTGGSDCNEEPLSINIETILIHPQYDPATSQKHDIAIIRLAQKAPYTDFIRPICLPRSDITVTDSIKRLTVAGWGSTETGRNSDVKRYVLLNVVPIIQCQRSYGNSLTERLSSTLQMCAGGEQGKDSCRGDSGGPLMGENNLIWTLHGVVSFGPTPCATLNVPGVYTKVLAYMPWIKQNMDLDN